MSLDQFFWALTGDDINVIGKCSAKTKSKFTIIGILVAFIFALCFFSSYFAFSQLFRNNYVGVPTGIFFALMITNIYLFLLYTLSKTGFPYIPNKTARYISTTIRVIFIIFIALIVSKPIESLVFSESLKIELESFKTNKLDKYRNSTNDFFEYEIKIIKDLISQKRLLNNVIDDSQEKYYENLILSKEMERDHLIGSMEKLVNGSEYYIQGIILLNYKFPFSWILTTFVISIFLVPVHLKIFIHKDSIFYKTKHYTESHLVRYEYEKFKEKYSKLYKAMYDINVQYTEHYVDPPFNTKRKIDEIEALTEDDLLKSIYA